MKLPRVPVADNVADGEMPKFRNLWEHIRPKMPKRGRGKAGGLDPLSLPTALKTALEALYGHYEKTFELWAQAGIEAPPCFIVVCNNTSTSKLVHDYIAGFVRENDDGSTTPVPGRLPLFRNFDEGGGPLPRPRTLLIDSEQLDSGEALDNRFRAAAGEEIERFRREIVARTGDRRQAERLSDADLLREVMNTVGRPGALGGSVRCVVSVSMLTEGWDARTVTHVLGVRAFGTQLLCEQVVGRALRRQSYDVNADGLFDVEYADVLGIPFDFTAKPVPVKPKPPRETVLVHAVSPERDACEICFPRVAGYRVELPQDRLTARFDADSTLTLTPELVGPSITRNEGIIGEGVDQTLQTEMLRDGFDHNGSPGVLVMLTGDGAGFADGVGFHADMERMHRRGWRIEVLSWRRSCNRRMREWAEANGKFIALDDFYDSITFLEPPAPGRPAAEPHYAAPLDLSRRP